ncbi:hypothetical protein KIN20_025567 [Parelaphostrongylus tenuis]|uniref:Uncharacterized protein n=1 Tax=Parelaphostrongylus tenuis TaxID=148309 RepID=A0AAD5N8Z3_PARTN|nr:hypothetical protein KIN20_025567 [Parelaphostrongylus tenuis]
MGKENVEMIQKLPSTLWLTDELEQGRHETLLMLTTPSSVPRRDSAVVVMPANNVMVQLRKLTESLSSRETKFENRPV